MKLNYKYNNMAYVIWFLGAFFFFIDYIIRVSPSILTPTLMQFFHTNAFSIGGFSGFFYYAYIGMQIPVGLLVDRFGPKWLLIGATLICAFSTFLFATMQHLSMGFLSRFLMGFGASFAFVGTLKLISIWFKAERFAFLAGLTQAMGMLGAMMGQGPMAMVYHQFGWQNCLYALSVGFVLLAVGMIFLIREKPHKLTSHQPISVQSSLISLFKNAQNCLNCLFIGLLYAPSACFGEQWGASFLSLVQSISIEKAGHETGILFIGLAIGCPLLGWLSDRMGRRVIIMQICVALCCLLLTLIIYGHALPIHRWLTPSVYMVLLFMYGFFNSGIVVSYALAAEINPHQQTGIALGVTNMASVILGALMIPIVGLILDNLWTGTIHQGIPVFSIQEYRIAFSALPIGCILAFGISLFQKETYCRKVN